MPEVNSQIRRRPQVWYEEDIASTVTVALDEDLLLYNYNLPGSTNVRSIPQIPLTWNNTTLFHQEEIAQQVVSIVDEDIGMGQLASNLLPYSTPTYFLVFTDEDVQGTPVIIVSLVDGGLIVDFTETW